MTLLKKKNFKNLKLYIPQTNGFHPQLKNQISPELLGSHSSDKKRYQYNTNMSKIPTPSLLEKLIIIATFITFILVTFGLSQRLLAYLEDQHQYATCRAQCSAQCGKNDGTVLFAIADRAVHPQGGQLSNNLCSLFSSNELRPYRFEVRATDQATPAPKTHNTITSPYPHHHGRGHQQATTDEQPGSGAINERRHFNIPTRRYPLLCNGVRGIGPGTTRWVVLLEEVQEAEERSETTESSEPSPQDGDGTDATIEELEPHVPDSDGTSHV